MSATGGGVLVLVEGADGGGLTPGSRSALGAGRLLANGLTGSVLALAFDDATAKAAAPWVEAVHVVALPNDGAEPRVRALQAAVEAVGARAVVMPSGRAGAAVAPRLAIRVGGSLLEEAEALEVRDGAVRAVRATYLQRVRETVEARVEPVVVTVGANAFSAPEPGDAGAVEALEVAFDGSDTRVEASDRRAAGGGRVPLGEARVVVAGGRGVGSADGFEALVLPLAEVLGAAVGATRAVVDAGWRPFEEQIGQTGKTVSPELYVALGISGAVQHLSGMNRSGTIVAIDRDADAPIFRVCDYGIVGDVHAVAPALRDALAAGG